MKKVYYDIALRAGGSHYPGVGGELLERFADLLVQEVIATIDSTPLNHAYTSYDVGLIDATVARIRSTILDKFGQ